MLYPGELKYIFIILGCLLYSTIGFGQIPRSEIEATTLKNKIDTQKDDAEKATLLLDLGEYFVNINIDSAIRLNDQSFKIAEKLKNYDLIFRYFSNQSYLHNLSGNFEQGLRLNKQGLNISRQIGDKTRQISMLGNTGISYSYISKYDSALIYLQQAHDLAEVMGDKIKMTKLNGVMGGMLNNMSKSTVMDSSLLYRSLAYHQKALAMARELNDSMLISDNLNGVALAYNNLEKTDLGKPYLIESLDISNKTGLMSNYAYALSTMSKILRNEKKFSEAISHGESAVQIYEGQNSIMGIIISLKELALNYNSAGMHDKAIDAVSRAENMALEYELDYILDGILINKAYFLYETKNYKNAYEYLLKGHNLADSLRGIEMKTNINELEKKYNTEKKENEILRLTTRQKRNQWIIWGLVLSLLALSLLTYIWYKNTTYKTRILEQEKEKLKTEQKLQATASIIRGQEEERTRMARDLHDGLGGMLSGLKYTLNNMGENVIITGQNVKTFEGAIDMLDQAIVEMRKVAHNMMPESLLRFGLDETLKDYVAKLNASIPLKVHYQSYNYRKLDQALEINLYRILQEVINNTVKHSGATDLYIQLDYKDDHINITAEDNGKGFDPADESIHKGIGMKNISDRVDYMNGTLEIQSAPGQGALIVIEIKNAQV